MGLSFVALESYLLHTVETGLKVSTFNRRSASVGQMESEEQKKRIALLRQMYNEVQHAKKNK